MKRVTEEVKDLPDFGDHDSLCDGHANIVNNAVRFIGLVNDIIISLTNGHITASEARNRFDDANHMTIEEPERYQNMMSDLRRERDSFCIENEDDDDNVESALVTIDSAIDDLQSALESQGYEF